LERQGEVWMTDINAAMLAVGRDKLIDQGVFAPLALCDAEKLPFPPDSFDCVSVAFGLRNMTHKEAALAEMARVTKPGGRVLVLEFSRPWKPLSRAYDAYSFTILPALGKYVAKDEAAVSLSRRIDPHASGPGNVEVDDGESRPRIGRVLQPRRRHRGAAPGIQGMRERFVNHVLRSAPLAMERLAKHAGRTVVVHVGPVDTALTIQTTGEVMRAVPGAARDLDVRISPFLLPRLAAGEEAAYRDIELEGDMELAQEISFIARNLDWDFEEDLSRAVGDVAAHRIAGGARAMRKWSRDAALRMAQGATEYWTEESQLIASRVKVEDFVAGVSQLRDAIERLEKRVERLES
jgi:ubiquinone biosynthesis protein UbiJ